MFLRMKIAAIAYNPIMANRPGSLRLMNRSEWGNGDNHLHKIWWFRHLPQKVGLWKGHLMNWLTMFLNLQRAAYPLGSDQPLVQTNVDLAGWFTFEVYAPPGTTQVTINVSTGRGVAGPALAGRGPAAAGVAPVTGLGDVAGFVCAPCRRWDTAYCICSPRVKML